GEVEEALIGEIMDGENGRDLPPLGEKKWNQARVPIIGVNNVRPPFSAVLVGDLRRDMIEEGKTQGVVLPLFAMLVLIGPARSIEKIGTIDQPNRHLRLGQACFEQPGFAASR